MNKKEPFNFFGGFHFCHISLDSPNEAHNFNDQVVVFPYSIVHYNCLINSNLLKDTGKRAR